MICLKVCCNPCLFHSWIRFSNRETQGAFYMVGDIESARAKGEKILADLEKGTS